MGFQGAGDQRQVRLLSAVSIVVCRGRAFVSKRVLCVRLCSWFPLMITFALMSGNRTGNEQPVTAAIIFFENRSIFNSFRVFQFMLVIDTNNM